MHAGTTGRSNARAYQHLFPPWLTKVLAAETDTKLESTFLRSSFTQVLRRQRLARANRIPASLSPAKTSWPIRGRITAARSTIPRAYKLKYGLTILMSPSFLVWGSAKATALLPLQKELSCQRFR
jgi:hypothetical protein